jgi:Co/Zn/Cd efflux system component
MPSCSAWKGRPASSGFVALKADALDFMGDAANYGISLYAVGQAVHWRSRAALAKAAGMGLIGLWVLGEALYRVFVTGVPSAFTMGVIGFLALLANLGCAALLFRFRRGDADMRSVWLCSRNDVAGNLACSSPPAACSRPAPPGPILPWRC